MQDMLFSMVAIAPKHKPKLSHTHTHTLIGGSSPHRGADCERKKEEDCGDRLPRSEVQHTAGS